MKTTGIDAATMTAAEHETGELLSALVQLDTSNPPGNETQVAELLDRYFRSQGLKGEVVGELPRRGNFVLQLEGQRPGPSLLLLAHEDVVPACAEEWQVPPFSGLISDGYVWGRGTVDVKNLIAANAVAVSRLARAGAPFAGRVVYAATADEEDGRSCGARWLVHNRPDLVRCDYVLNEGGGTHLRRAGHPVYVLNTGEKGTAQFKIIVRGDAGHASRPLRVRNAMVAAARIVETLSAHETPVVVNDAAAELVDCFVTDPGLCKRLQRPASARSALAELAASDAQVAEMIEPLFGFSFSPTIVTTNSQAANVYPSQVQITVDCRVLVGQSEDEVEAEVGRALADVDADWSFQWITPVVRGNASRYPSPLSEAISCVLARHVPESETIAAHSAGFTDSNWFRSAYPETIAYNFAPQIEESDEDVIGRCHGIDERIHVRDLAFQALFAERVALELLSLMQT